MATTRKPPAPKIRLVDPATLRPHPKNPRVHPDSAIDRLINSIERFGWTNPILLSKDGYIVAGEGRWKAAMKKGLKSVPVVDLDLGGAEALAYMVADNRLQDLTDWEPNLLKSLFAEFDPDLLNYAGFTQDEAEALLRDYEARGHQTFLDSQIGQEHGPSSIISGESREGRGEGDAVAFVSYQIAPAQKFIVNTAIQHAMTAFGLTDPGQALVHVCDVYIRSQTKSPVSPAS